MRLSSCLALRVVLPLCCVAGLGPKVHDLIFRKSPTPERTAVIAAIYAIRIGVLSVAITESAIWVLVLPQPKCRLCPVIAVTTGRGAPSNTKPFARGTAERCRAQ